MRTLGIFTVKRFILQGNIHYTFGGFGHYLDAILPYFDRVILVCHVAPGEPGEGYYPVTDNRIEFIPLSGTRSELDVLLSLPMMIHRARTVIGRMDVVHARMPDYTGIVGAVVARWEGVPCFHQIIADWYEQARRTSPLKQYGLGTLLKLHLYLYDYLERLVCKGQLVFAQGLSCYEKHARRSDCRLVVSSSHNLGDIVGIIPARFTSTPGRILNVARLDSVKNQQLLLRAISILRTLGEEYVLTLVGEGPRRKDLEEDVKKSNLEDRVIFKGLVRHGQDLWKCYDNADVFVLPSRSEGTPKVILEAMARGVPVVASRVSGVPTLVTDGETGLLFEDNDLDGLVDRLLRIKKDEGIRLRIMSNALTFARNHTVKAETSRMMEAVFSKWPHLAGD